MSSPYQSIWFINDVRKLVVAGTWPTYVPTSPVTLNGWISGGQNSGPNQSAVERLTYATDTTNSSVRSNLSIARYELASATNGTNVWWAAGAANDYSVIDRTILASDTVDAVARSFISNQRNGITGVSNGTNGWFCGGTINGGTHSSTVDRLVYATDTTNTTTRGQLSQARSWLTSVSDGTNGWFYGGDFGPDYSSLIDRIVYATDTATGTSRSHGLLKVWGCAGVSNGTNGWWVGGNTDSLPGNVETSNIQRTIFASDTVDATNRGQMSQPRFKHGATTDGTNMWFLAGGTVANVYYSTIDRMTIATDTTNAIFRSNTSAIKLGVGNANNTSGAGY